MSENNGKTNGHKPGPKLKIDDGAKAEIFACLTVGASLQDASDYVGIARCTLTRLKQSDPEFAQGCAKAIKKGKLHCLNKIGKATAWQAAAWMLERRWYQEFSRKDKVEHSGPRGGPIVFDVSKLTDDELRTIRSIHNRLAATGTN